MDNKLSFNIFTFEKEHKAKAASSGSLPESASNIASYARELKAAADAGRPHADPGIAWDDCFSEESIATHVDRCSDSCVSPRTLSPRRCVTITLSPQNVN